MTFKNRIIKCHIISQRNDLESHLAETPFRDPCFLIWKYIFWSLFVGGPLAKMLSEMPGLNLSCCQNGWQQQMQPQ